MSQVLEKPILLDETGQAIAGKLDTNSAAIIEALDDIKDAIGTSSEFIPVKIQVVTPPTKTIYKVGERLDLTGMVVNLVGTNGVQVDVTSGCTFSPANGATLTASDTTVTVTYVYQHESTTFTTSQALTIRELSSIAVTTPPVKTAYQTGETLDLTGIVVTATYSDGFTANVTSDCTFNPANGTVLTSSDTSVDVTYIEGSVTKTTSVAIGVKELVSIAVTHLPTKTAYHAGEGLDLTGMVVTATYDDSSTLDVTAHCTTVPIDGTVLTTSDTSITITYTEGLTTKTTTQAITVSELASISVTTPPTKVKYSIGETLDLTGMVVTAAYDDLSTETVTQYCTFSPDNGDTLTSSDTSVTITYTSAGVTKTTTQALTICQLVYGIQRDTTSSDSEWTRTDDSANFTFSASVGDTAGHSDFDDVYPWSDIERVTVDGNVYVKIPKFWFKRTVDSNNIETIQIAGIQKEGFALHPAFNKAGTQYDYILVGAYEYGQNNPSKSGETTETNKTRASFRTVIRTKGGFMLDIATRSAIQMLVLVEVADWNVQAIIGQGKTFATAQERLTTGTCDGVANLTGRPSGTDNGSLGVIWRGIENLWGDICEWIDGFIYNSKTSGYPSFKTQSHWICNDPSKYADTLNESDYTYLEYTLAYQSAGFIKTMGYDSNNPAYMLPASTGASSTTYITDYAQAGYNNNTNYCCRTMNDVNSAGSQGIGEFNGQNEASYSHAMVGARMCRLPSA